MRTVLCALAVLAMALTGCSGEEASSAVEIELSAPPPIDEEYSGSYWTSASMMPPIENPDIPVRLSLDSDETILKGWFAPDGSSPIQGFASDGTLSWLPPIDGDTYLINYLKAIPGEGFGNARMIDVILTIENPSGSIKTVSITDARFDIDQ